MGRGGFSLDGWADGWKMEDGGSSCEGEGGGKDGEKGGARGGVGLVWFSLI